MVAITTVGYGDLYPRTHWGRGIMIFACFIGTLLISLIVVALSTTTSLDEEENKAYMILQRKKLRLLYTDCCQNIIRGTFKILQLKRSQTDSNLANSHAFAKLIYELKTQSHNKIVYKRQIDDMVINSDMDKLGTLESVFRENLTSINDNLSKFYETHLKIRKMKKNQKTLLNNIEDIIKITSN